MSAPRTCARLCTMAYSSRRYSRRARPSRRYAKPRRSVRRTSGRTSRAAIATVVRDVHVLKQQQRRAEPKQQVTLAGFGETKFSPVPAGQFGENPQYFVVPVTKALPPQVPADANFVSDTLRRRRLVRITSVSLQLLVSHSDGCRIAAILHSVHADDAGAPTLGVGGVPVCFPVGVQEGKQLRLMNREESKIALGRSSPYAVLATPVPSDKPGQIQYAYSLRSADGGMFGAPLASDPTHVGKVTWRLNDGEEQKGRQSVNAIIPSPRSTSGAGQKDKLTMVWHMDKVIEFDSETSVDVVGKHLRVTVEVTSSATSLLDDGPVTSGCIENSMLDIYFHSSSA